MVATECLKCGAPIKSDRNIGGRCHNTEACNRRIAKRAERLALERCPYCHTAYTHDGDGVCPEVLRQRRAIMPDYDKKLEDWLS